MAIKADIKKLGGLFLLLFLCAQVAHAGGIILKGETFKAKEDIRFFTLEECKALLKDLNEVDILRKEVSLRKEIEIKLLEKNADYEKVIKLQETAIVAYEKSIKSLELEVNSLRAAIQDCQESVRLLKDTIQIQKRREKRNAFRRKIERTLWGIAGLWTGNKIAGFRF